MSVKVTRKNAQYIKGVLKRYKGGEVAIGWPIGNKETSAKYPDNTEVLNVAAWNQYGTNPDDREGIPRRDFMTPGGQDAVEKTGPIAKAAVRAINEGKTTAEKTLKVMGQQGAASIKKAIRDLKDPPNAPGTIQQKRSSNPLVDTGLLVQTVTYSVRKS